MYAVTIRWLPVFDVTTNPVKTCVPAEFDQLRSVTSVVEFDLDVPFFLAFLKT